MTTSNQQTTVIVGAGHAGVQAAASLREYGFLGRVLLINDEDQLPYERPPLSKTFDAQRSVVPLRPQAFYDDKHIELVMGHAVTTLDANAKSLTLSDGQTIAYDHAIVCTGSGPLRVPPFAAPDPRLPVYVLRNAPDEAALRAALDAGRLNKLLVVGAGFIGLESAAALAGRLEQITVVDLAPTAMGRGVVPEIGAMCVDALASAGVDVRFETKIETVQPLKGAVSVTLTGGDTLDVDAILLSVGAKPNDQLLVEAGLGQHRAITAAAVDGRLDRADGLYAVGDMVMAPHPLLGEEPMRLESVDVAVLQAKSAAAAICGAPAPRVQAPWFWSTQGQNKMQMVGLKGLASHWILRVEGSADRPTASALGFDDGNRLVAAQCLNNPRDFAASRKFWGTSPKGDLNSLADIKTAMKEVF